MTPQDVLAGVREVLVETFFDESLQVDRTTTALDVPGWDSLSHTIVILALEKRFGVTIPAGSEFPDVGALVDAIVRQAALS